MVSREDAYRWLLYRDFSAMAKDAARTFVSAAVAESLIKGRPMTLGDIYPYDCTMCGAPCDDDLCPTCADREPEWTEADLDAEYAEMLGDAQREGIR